MPLPINKAQADAIVTTTTQLSQRSAQLNSLMAEVSTILANGETITFDFSPTPVALTQAQDDDIVAKYNTLKSQIQALFLQLP